MKVLVVFYSMYGHIYKMAQAIAEGATEVPGAEVVLRRVPETLSDDILGKMGALEAQKSMATIPVCKVDELGGADAVIFGTPTRFGNMCGQMRIPGRHGRAVGEGSASARWEVSLRAPAPNTAARNRRS